MPELIAAAQRLIDVQVSEGVGGAERAADEAAGPVDARERGDA